MVLVVFLLLLSPAPDTSRVQTEASEHEARERNNCAPRLWLKCWVLHPKAARGGGDAPRPRRPGEAAPSATPRPRPNYNTREATPASRKRTDGPARTLRARGTSSARARDAHTARLACTTGASPDAQNGASPGTQSGASHSARVSRRAERRVLRRAKRRVFRRAYGTLPRRAKCLLSEPVCLDSGLVAA